MDGPSENFWTTLPLGCGVTLLACDANGVAALNKPAGVLSHPNSPADEERSLLVAHYDAGNELFAWKPTGGDGGGSSKLWLLNRLDSVTSGVILVAASEKLAREIKARFKRKQVRKIYRALVFGVPARPRQIWRDRLDIDKRGGRIRTSAGTGVPAECSMRLVRTQPGPRPMALLQLEPRSGRSHQLRVQCARRSLPIAGDANYGDFKRNHELAQRTGHRRLFLHSLETSFDYELAGKKFSFSAHAPLPPEFEGFF
ncbi:MAG: RNA pseudouridine synthase [Verrucomicrobiota bacterium]|nr:RNA pseudouridine synthase [Verrucomicrobiota bacterium]